MTTERWDDERLDRLASIVENNARLAESNSLLIESNARSILALANAAAEAREERDRLFQRMDQVQETIVQQQAEIAGLRTETNRLLDQTRFKHAIASFATLAST